MIYVKYQSRRLVIYLTVYYGLKRSHLIADKATELSDIIRAFTIHDLYLNHLHSSQVRRFEVLFGISCHDHNIQLCYIYIFLKYTVYAYLVLHRTHRSFTFATMCHGS